MENQIQFWLNGSVEIIEGDGEIALDSHTHHSLVVSVVTNGSALFKIRGIPYRLSGCEGYVLPPNTPIEIKPITRNQYKVICIKDNTLRTAAASPVFRCNPGRFQALCDGLKEPSGQNNLLHDIAQITGIALHSCHQGDRAVHSAVADSVRYIHSHLDEKFCLDQLAASVYLSKYHLERIFKSTMGITPKQYMTQCRLRKAKKLIMAGNPGTEIAAELAFATQSHLCTVFKKQVGVRVETYRRNARQIPQ